MIKILNYIDGELVQPFSNEFLDNINPATGKIYSQISNSNPDDALLAIKAAKAAYPAWRALGAGKRADILRKIASLIKEQAPMLAEAETIDNGKPLAISSTVDIPRSAQNLEFFADAITQYSNKSYDTDDQAINYILRNPLGVVVTISPWNLPLYLFTWKIAPALATGNTVVAKPSEVTPMTAYLFSKICIEAGLPKGVLNILHGEGPRIGETLMTNKDVKAVSFTGSTATGRIISQTVAPLFKKVSLEMGGKNPNIIFSDCDFDQALSNTMRSSFANQGQICLCGSRIFIERSLYPKFREALVERIKRIKQGNPLDPKIKQGALVSKAHMEKVLSYIEIAKQEGGNILTGGKRFESQGENTEGYFVEPTLIENLAPKCRTNQEEIFGPVATITPFDTEEEVLSWANSTEYGLSASIWTQDISRAHRMARDIESGIVWLNTWMLRDLRTPFGGMKSSGVGREGGVDALNFFTEVKNVCLKI